MKTLRESLFDKNLADKDLFTVDHYYKPYLITIAQMNVSVQDMDAYEHVFNWLDTKNINKDFKQSTMNIDDLQIGTSWDKLTLAKLCKKAKSFQTGPNDLEIFIKTILALPITGDEVEDVVKEINEFLEQFKKYYKYQKLHIQAVKNWGGFSIVLNTYDRYYFSEDDYENGIRFDINFERY